MSDGSESQGLTAQDAHKKSGGFAKLSPGELIVAGGCAGHVDLALAALAFESHQFGSRAWIGPIVQSP